MTIVAWMTTPFGSGDGHTVSTPNTPESDSKSARLFRYVFVILDRPGIGSDWQAWLTFELSSRGFLLGRDGEIHEMDNQGAISRMSLLGFFRFLNVEETLDLLREARAEVSALASPSSGPVRGAIAWEYLSLDEVRSLFLPTLVYSAWGPVIRTEDLSFREIVREVAFDLRHLLSKFGFDDGGAFLSRAPDYMSYVEKAARQGLNEAGLDAEVGAQEGTHHNPLRIWTPIRRKRDGKEVGESALDGKLMTIWAYDYSCLDDASFWW